MQPEYPEARIQRFGRWLNDCMLDELNVDSVEEQVYV
jgi:hypothetical protein